VAKAFGSTLLATSIPLALMSRRPLPSPVMFGLRHICHRFPLGVVLGSTEEELGDRLQNCKPMCSAVFGNFSIKLFATAYVATTLEISSIEFLLHFVSSISHTLSGSESDQDEITKFWARNVTDRAFLSICPASQLCLDCFSYCSYTSGQYRRPHEVGPTSCQVTMSSVWSMQQALDYACQQDEIVAGI
jgi:hypothetical protein